MIGNYKPLCPALHFHAQMPQMTSLMCASRVPFTPSLPQLPRPDTSPLPDATWHSPDHNATIRRGLTYSELKDKVWESSVPVLN